MTAEHETPLSVGDALGSQGIGSEQQALLDLIDKIQYAQLEGIRLPRIAVVGDQSAGKSSVLEAVTGIPFPRDAGACTRFATEIRLRRAKEEKFNVQILPDVNRPIHERERLQRFAANVTTSTSFETVMRHAVAEIAPQNVPGRFAAKDVLVVEKSGPNLPLLTVVDLPGLVKVANKDQSEDDIQAINDLTDRYMKSSRTIILAIVGGNQDYVQAPVLTKARQFDPRGNRTIGVLTKPDLTRTIGLEDKFIALVNNKDKHTEFKLGWYVLRNPGPHDFGHEWSSEERQHQEDEFFSEGKWSTLPSTMRGSSALKQKLSQQLMRHIAQYVPKLRKEIKELLVKCEAELKSLGTGKDTIPEMRRQLFTLSMESNKLVTPAVDGTYKNPGTEKFFPKIERHTDSKIPTPPQRLRARVVKENGRFALRVREQGHKLDLVSSSGTPADVMMKITKSNQTTKEEYAKRVIEPFIEENKGTEFIGDYNPRLVYHLFHDFSENWPTLAQEHKDNMGVICNEFLAEVIDYVWPQYMREKLRTEFLSPQIGQLLGEAQDEVDRLGADQVYEVQSYDPEYELRLKDWRTEASTEGRQFSRAEELLEKMLIHYDLSAKTFISNVITQVVERHLLQKLYNIFDPVKVDEMDDQKVEDIAAEDIEIRERRMMLKERKKAIEESLEACINIAMRKDLRAFTVGELYSVADESSDEEFSKQKSTPSKPKSSRTRSSTSRATTSPVPKQSPQHQQHQPSYQQAPQVNIETSADRVSTPFRSTEMNSEPSTSINYNGRRPVPSEWENAPSTHYLHAVPNSNQHTSPAAPQYTPPPPPPRPAKVPEQGGNQHIPVSPVDSINQTTFDSQDQSMTNGHRYNNSYSQQDFNSASRVSFGDVDNYGQTSTKKSTRKLPLFSKA